MCDVNANFLKSEMEYQEKSKAIQYFKSNNNCGCAIGIGGFNGSGKTVYSSVTSLFGSTLFVNFESMSRASIPKKLASEGLIQLLDLSDDAISGNNVNIILDKIANIINSNKDIKVIVFDSIRRFADSYSNQLIKMNCVDIQDRESMFKLGNFFSRVFITKLVAFAEEYKSLGKIIIFTCGLEFDSDDKIVLQCDIKAVRTYYNAELDGRYVLTEQSLYGNDLKKKVIELNSIITTPDNSHTNKTNKQPKTKVVDKNNLIIDDYASVFTNKNLSYLTKDNLGIFSGEGINFENFIEKRQIIFPHGRTLSGINCGISRLIERRVKSQIVNLNLNNLNK